MDWSDGDFIFLSGYSFPDDLLSAVFDRARALKMGSKVVTLSLPEDKDKLYRKFHFSQCVCYLVVVVVQIVLVVLVVVVVVLVIFVVVVGVVEIKFTEKHDTKHETDNKQNAHTIPYIPKFTAPQ